MVNKPVIAILASQTKEYDAVIAEPRRLFELASQVFADQAHFVLVGCEDFAEVGDNALGILSGYEREKGTIQRVSFQEPLLIDYFVKRQKGQGRVVNKDALRERMPRLYTQLDEKDTITTKDLIISLQRRDIIKSLVVIVSFSSS